MTEDTLILISNEIAIMGSLDFCWAKWIANVTVAQESSDPQRSISQHSASLQLGEGYS